MKRSNSVTTFVTQLKEIHKAMPSLGKVPKESKGMNLESQANSISDLDVQIGELTKARAKLVRRKGTKVKATRTFLTSLRQVVRGLFAGRLDRRHRAQPQPARSKYAPSSIVGAPSSIRHGTERWTGWG